MEQNFDLFSSVENTKKTRHGNLKDNQIQLLANLKTRGFYVRFNRALTDKAAELGFGNVTPVLNNLTGEVYIVFHAGTEIKPYYPLTDNGGSSKSYIYSKDLVEYLVTTAARRKVENMNDIWTISGDLSINPGRIVVRIEKCFA